MKNRAVPTFFIALALALLTACPEKDPAAPDAGPGGGGGGSSDGGVVVADGGPPPPPVERRANPSQIITSGGGQGGNDNYRVRVIIGGPAAAGAQGASPTHRVELGAGATQHRP